MPMIGRVVLPHYSHHVVQWGDNRKVAFAEGVDYAYYLRALAEYNVSRAHCNGASSPERARFVDEV